MKEVCNYIMVNSLPKLWGKSPNQCIHLMQGSANFSVKGKYFRLCRIYRLCLNYSTLSLQHESHHTQHVNKQVWLCINKTLYAKIGICWIWPVVYELLM